MFQRRFWLTEAFLLTVFKGVLWGIGIAVGVSVLMIAAGRKNMGILRNEHVTRWSFMVEHGGWYVMYDEFLLVYYNQDP